MTPMLDVGNRVVMVSGASRGLGLAIARKLHDEGYRLSLGVRDTSAEALSDRTWDKSRVFVQTFDATVKKSARVWAEATLTRFGQIDGLINNAAIAHVMKVEVASEADEDLQEAVFDEMLTVNLKAPLRLIRAALPHLKRCGHGRVVNVASLSGKRLGNLSVGYPMTKFALVALTHGVRRVGWEHGIRTTVLCPGYIRTRMAIGPAATAGVSEKDMSTPEELAEIVSLLLRLPNTSSVAELLVNNRFEDML